MQQLRSRVALLGAAITIGAVALPAAAGAAIVSTPDVGANTLTVTTDANGSPDDAITLTIDAADDTYVVSGVDSDLPVTEDTVISVDAGVGNDNIDASALGLDQYGALTLHGGAGNDVILGGASAGAGSVRDQIFGDDGNDRVNGFRGNDDQFGGLGNDTLVWNNLDGSDTSTGDAGADTVEFNGNVTGADVITIQPSATAGKVNVHRVAGNVDIDALVERIAVNSLAGDDSITAVDGINALGLSGGLTLDGGAGSDTIVGGDTTDTILGGDDVDVLSGGAGNDFIAGGRANDTMNGGAGDDVLSWSNGDANDITNGNDGIDVTEVLEGAANDVNTVAPNGARTMFARTSAAAFTMDMDTELLSLKSFGGDDSLAVAAGVGAHQSIVADGGAGNDTLLGGDEIDTFVGNAGNDTLDGGTGSDLLDGQDGDDTLRARDGIADLARGGAGNDNAQVDATDAVDGVESVDVPIVVAPDVKAFAATVTSGTVRVTRSKGRLLARVPVTCPTTETGGCKVALTLQTASRVKVGGVRAIVLLGTKTVSLRSGQKATVTVTLSSGAAKLARKGKIAARASIWSSDSAGNAASSSRRVSIVVPRAK